MTVKRKLKAAYGVHPSSYQHGGDMEDKNQCRKLMMNAPPAVMSSVEARDSISGAY